MEREIDAARVLTRRAVLQSAAWVGAGAFATSLAAEPARAEESPQQRAAAFRGEHAVKPLPFAPTKLKGLSEKLITSHHDNNYAGAVKRLNLIQQQLGSLPA